MLLMPDASSAILDPVHRGADALAHLRDRRSAHARAVPRRIRAASRKRAEEYLRSTGIADTAYFGPECEFFVFDEVSYELGPNRSHYLVDSAEGHWNSGKAGPRLHGAREGGLLPAGAARHAPRPAHADGADARAARHPVRVPPPRGRVGRPVRDRPALPDADADGRPGDDLQVRRQERRARGGQDA